MKQLRDAAFIRGFSSQEKPSMIFSYCFENFQQLANSTKMCVKRRIYRTKSSRGQMTETHWGPAAREWPDSGQNGHHMPKWEAAKKNRHNIHRADPNSMVGLAAMHRPKQQQPSRPTCQGCGHPTHQGGRRQCPAYNQMCMSCHKVGHFAKVCCSKSVNCAGAYYNNSTRVPRTLSKGHAWPFIGQGWTMISTTWYHTVGSAWPIRHPIPRNQWRRLSHPFEELTADFIFSVASAT